MPKFTNTVKKELFSFSSLLFICCFVLGYLSLSVFLLNNKLLLSEFAHTKSLGFVLLLFFRLVGGLWTGLSPLDFFLLLLTSILIGLNVLLIIKTLDLLKHAKKLKLSIGGATVISIITTGCASCGLSLLSLLGLSATLSFLPFHGMELHIIAIGLLFFSFWYMLRKLHEGKYCKVEKKK